MLTRLESLESLSFFVDPGKGISRLPRIETSDRPTIGPIVSGIISTCCSALGACYHSIACLLHCGRGTHTRHTDAAKQRTVAYVSGRVQRRQKHQRRQMFLPPGADNLSYARPGSAHAAASVCLYREQERPLRCRPIVWPHPTAGLGLPYPASGSSQQ